jgi:hypothetical protein
MAAPTHPGFRRYPLLLGVSAGLLLAVVVAIFCPTADLKPGDSRVLMAIVGAVFFVPGSLATVYAGRSALRSIRQMPRLGFAWMAGALFFTVAVAITARNEWTESRRYIREGRSVNGNVVETHPQDHDTLIVAYTISGVDYHSRSSGPRVARSYRPGDAIRVYYFASAPAQGFCIEPRWRPDLVLISWVLAAGVLPLWGIGLWGAIESRRRRTPSNEPPQATAATSRA